MLELIDGRAQTTPVHIPRPRPVFGGGDPETIVRDIVDDVRLRGDAALVDHSARLEGTRVEPDRLRVDAGTIRKARDLVRPELVDALEVMAERLRSVCEHQLPRAWSDERPDEMVGELVVPLRRIGLYVAGGPRAYASSIVMGAVPAQVAGVEGIAVASPAGQRPEVAEPVLAACAILGIDEVYRVGGAHAIAALAYGTETVRPVDKIVGSGDVYVTLAKRRTGGWVGTGPEAGPPEVAVVADVTADPRVVAADLVAQAEHGANGTHVLITWAPELVDRVNTALDLMVATHERPDDVENALTEGGRAVLVADVDHAIDTLNAFAPEHVELMFDGDDQALPRVRNAGAVFVGASSPVAAGDYVGGTNHLLPGGGAARWSSGLSARDFVKHVYVSSLRPGALERLVDHVDALSEAEGLHAHGRAVRLRLRDPSERGLL